MPDKIEIEILDDGIISVKTGDISAVNHISADELLDMLEKELGGNRKTEKRQHTFWKNRNVLRGGKIEDYCS